MVYYQDNEIIIRDIINEDVVNLLIWRLDKEINKYDPRPIPHNSKELVEECVNHCKRFDTEIIIENINDRKYRYFMISNKENQLIGFVNFFCIDKVKKQGEMGVIIGDKSYWSKGVGHRAVSATINYIFNNMDIDRIYIETGEANKPALGLFEKLNFKRCGEYIEDESFKFIIMEKKRIDG